MTLCEELYFEITLTGKKSELKQLVSFLRSGELDDFFEFESDYVIYDDGFDAADSFAETSIVFTNDDCGIEIDEFDTDEFLDVFCRAARSLDVTGSFYDIDDEEFCFSSEAGDPYYVDTKKISHFNEDDDLREADR